MNVYYVYRFSLGQHVPVTVELYVADICVGFRVVFLSDTNECRKDCMKKFMGPTVYVVYDEYKLLKSHVP